MLRKIAAIIVGLTAAVLIITAVQLTGHQIYPPPVELDHNRPETVKAYMDTAPLGAFLFILAAWALGSFTAGLTSGLIARGTALPALVCGCVLLFLGIFNLISFEHPVWFWPAVAFVFIPPSWLGYRLVKKKP